MTNGLGSADLHIHTAASDGMASPEDVVRWAAEHTTLDVIAVTDHDRLDGALRAREYARTSGAEIEVVPGIEVTTRRGHLLALFVEEPVSSLRSLSQTIEAVHAQGGLCIIPHPMSLLPPSLRRRTIDGMMAPGNRRQKVDGIEVINPTPVQSWWQHRVRRRNAESWHLAETGGSDAHFLEQIGSAVTRFPGRSAADLRLALDARLASGEQRSSPPLRALGLRRLAHQQGRAMLATPKAVVGPALRRRLRVKPS
jgi:predicted metal-dependent phosphoesterase TrpH